MVRWWSVVCLGCAVALGCGRSVQHGDDDGTGAGTGGASASGGGDIGGTGGAGSNGGGKGGSGSSGKGAGGTAASGGTGGTTMSGGSAGRAGGTGGVTGGTAGGGMAGEAGAPFTPECVLAVRLDECCSEPRPVSGAEFDAEPCYREFLRGILPRDGDYCEPIPCPAIPCNQPPLPSRVVQPLNGGCGFVLECATSDDCALGLDRNQCCSCAEALPVVLLSDDSCVTPVATSSSKACADCGDVLCEPCPESLPVGCLVQQDALNRCGFVVPQQGLDENECVSEQPCVAATAPGIRCYAPGEVYCAGPAPPPDECGTDTDCGESSSICEPLGHCGQKQCVEGCASSDDCASYEDCTDDQRCVPRSCGLESDCGPTHACLTGVCTRRSCTESSDCGSAYCVNGQCHDEPGRCLDAFAP